MAGAASWKGAIQFGLIQFTVSARSAIDASAGFSFNMHHGGETGCHERLKQGDMVCLGCGALVPRSDVEKGYNGKAPVDMEYIESLEAEKSGLINIDAMVQAEQIDPRYFQKSYDVTPDKGAEAVYVLFRQVLEKQKRVALGKVVMSGKEYLCVFRPKGTIVAMEVLYWPEELKSSAQAETSIEGATVSAASLKLGMQLATAMVKDFDPSAFKNEYAASLGEYLEEFLAGEVTPAVALPKPKVKTSDNLEDALQRSLRALAGGAAEKPAAKPAKKAKVA